jgi:hypothetical protein
MQTLAGDVNGLLENGFPGFPWAMAAGLTVLTFTAAVQSNIVPVTFPAGRFAVAPIVVMGINSVGTSTPIMVRMSSAPTSSGFSMVANATSSMSGTYNIGWVAVQMLATDGRG